MTVRHHRNDWMIDVGIEGQRHREYGFTTKAQAKEREKELKASRGKTPRNVSLTQFVDRWNELHGFSLRDKYRYSRTLAVAERIGGNVKEFDAAKFAAYRVDRINEVSVSTVNHETRYFRALFSEMIRLGQYAGDNPMATIRVLPEFERELSYLTQSQINILLEALDSSRNPHVGIVARICLATGARWGEAQGLHRSQVMIEDRVCLLKFARTKNGKVRYVPVSRTLAESILRVGENGPLFHPCRDAFRSSLKRNRIHLPPGQQTHILRHTFASHFMMNGGDILTLQRILGHSDLKLTMRYSHLSADHLAKVLELNPLSGLGLRGR